MYVGMYVSIFISIISSIISHLLFIIYMEPFENQTIVHNPNSRFKLFKTLYKRKLRGDSCCGSVVMNLTSVCDSVGLIPGLTKWVKDLALQ